MYCEVVKLEQSITKKRVGTEVGIRSIKTDGRAVLRTWKRPPTSSPGNAIGKHSVLNTFPHQQNNGKNLYDYKTLYSP